MACDASLIANARRAPMFVSAQTSAKSICYHGLDRSTAGRSV